MRPLLLAALLLITMLAGCADTPAPGEEPDGEGEPAMEDGLAMPQWQVGHWWSYNTGDRELTMAVTQDAGAAWLMETNDEEMAFYQEAFGPISYLGEQRKADLAGSQAEGPVQFFDWPLSDGKTWTTQWDARQVDITAQGAGFESFRMEARAGDELVVEYQYSASTGWFDWMQFHGSAGDWRIDLVDSGSNYNGEIVHVESTLIHSQSGSAETGSATFAPFNAGDDADVYLFYSFACPEIGNGFGAPFMLGVGPIENIPGTANGGLAANDDGFTIQGNCPFEESDSIVIGVHPNEGTWGYAVEAPQGSTYSFTVYLREFERITL